MRRLSSFLLATGLIWTGCVGGSLGTSAIAQRNIENIARVSVGMSDKQVFQIMRQPYRKETIEVDQDQYEIWFYITRPILMDQTRLLRWNLTPLVLKNGILRGMGFEYYNWIVERQDVAAKLEQSKEQKESLEDIPLERALETPSQFSPAQKSFQTPQQQMQPPAQQPPKKGETGPVQPEPQQPPPPVQPPPPQNPLAPTPPPKGGPPPAGQKKGGQGTPPQNNVSMSKKPAPAENPPDKEPEPKAKVPLTEEDQQMLDQEQEENFNFW